MIDIVHSMKEDRNEEISLGMRNNLLIDFHSEVEELV